jgi:hypothetical protein
MADRERKRAERQKRKARGAARRTELTERMSASYEAKNQAAREKLEPLAEDERPLVVTVCAVIAALLAIASPIAYLAGAEIRGERPPLINVIWPMILMGMAAYGMWKARYWAVLGFDVILALFILIGALGLVAAPNVGAAIVYLALVAIAGTLFYFMVKAMARIQMPDRPSRPPL